MKDISLKKVFGYACMVYGVAAMAITAGIGSALNIGPCDGQGGSRFEACKEFNKQSKFDFKVGAGAAAVGGVVLLATRRDKKKPKR